MTTDTQPAAESMSPIYARAERLRPQVQQPNSPWTMILGVGGVALLGFFAFSTLSNSRSAHAQPQPLKVADQPAPAWAPALQTLLAQNTLQPPAPMAANPPPPTQPLPFSTPPTPPQPDPSEPHYKAPAVVVDLGDNQPAGAAKLAGAMTGIAGAPTPGAAEDARLNAEERFAARVTGATAETARATQIRNLSLMIPQGFVIPATLETAIDSDLPGSVRATVSRDVRGFDGTLVLIPRGSKIIGQYRSAAAVGQKRAFIVWSRIITPTGVSIDVGSPATDELGRGGLAGKTDNHFFERFGASILLSVISAGVDAAGRGSGNSTQLVIGSASQANQVASIALQKQIDIPTTIRVPQGAAVQVSVARDLDFAGVAALR